MGDLLRTIDYDKQNFKWHTQDGRILSLDEMDTKHIFNSMKMYYNHIARQVGLPEIWFIHEYDDHYIRLHRIPEAYVKVIVIFIHEIETRGDLSEIYYEPYYKIIQVICKMIGIKMNRLAFHSTRNQDKFVEEDVLMDIGIEDTF